MKLTKNSRGRKRCSLPSCAPSCAPQASTNTKGNGEKDGGVANADNDGDVRPTRKAVAELAFLPAAQKNISAEDVERLRRQIVSLPAAWELAGNSMESVRRFLIEKMSGGVKRATMLAEIDILAKRLDYDAAPPLEQLLIDQVLTAHLRLIHAETCYNQNAIGTVGIVQARFWIDLLTSAQARFLRAAETLARVRRLARNTPALQINIANEGGKQVDVQTKPMCRMRRPSDATRTESLLQQRLQK